MNSIENLSIKYLRAKRYVMDCGYFEEIEFYDSRTLNELTSQSFLMELAWVILSSGMREKVIRSIFDRITEAFCEWSAEKVCNNIDACYRKALSVFNNEKKIQAILFAIMEVNKVGIEEIKSRILEEGIEYLKTYPFIGDITVYHIAKNIGLNVSKPDRHLLRIARVNGYDTPHNMCLDIAQIVGDEENIVDTVLWRYATLDSNYLSFLVG